VATYKVTPATAKRVIGLLELHKGDIPAARHDVWIGLQSLGGYYTDRASERVHAALDWLDRKPAERIPALLATMKQIAEGEVIE
jgi:hypothetical protein